MLFEYVVVIPDKNKYYVLISFFILFVWFHFSLLQNFLKMVVAIVISIERLDFA
jgi:hypothetical protein